MTLATRDPVSTRSSRSPVQISFTIKASVSVRVKLLTTISVESGKATVYIDNPTVSST